ncbi:MAG: hypothetical protein U1F41_07950 [Burkholderiales bacterium]
MAPPAARGEMTGGFAAAGGARSRTPSPRLRQFMRYALVSAAGTLVQYVC